MREQILSSWESQIKDYPKLKFNGLKKLNKEYLSETDLVKKNEIKEKMIHGTMYIVLGAIKNSALSRFQQNIYDLNDIIVSTLMAWSDVICSSELDYYNSFSQIYNRNSFGSRSARYLFGRESTRSMIPDNSDTRILFFSVVFNEYLRILKKYPDKDEYVDKFKSYLYRIDSNINPESLIQYFNCIIDSFTSTLEEMNLNRTNTYAYRWFLINNGYENYYNSSEDVIDEEPLESYENECLIRDFQNFVLTTDILDKREKNMIIDYFGLLGNDSRTLEYLKEKYGISGSRSAQVINKALNKLYKYLPESLNIDEKERDSRRILMSYESILKKYGRQIKFAAEEYKRVNRVYPSFTRIKKVVTMTGVTPSNSSWISNSGDVYIPSIRINGFLPETSEPYYSKVDEYFKNKQSIRTREYTPTGGNDI